jgi:hypothetical protein
MICQILGPDIPKWKKPSPNDHKLYQKAVPYAKCPYVNIPKGHKIWQRFLHILRPFKFCQNWDFREENKQSGKPNWAGKRGAKNYLQWRHQCLVHADDVTWGTFATSTCFDMPPTALHCSSEHQRGPFWNSRLSLCDGNCLGISFVACPTPVLMTGSFLKTHS